MESGFLKNPIDEAIPKICAAPIFVSPTSCFCCNLSFVLYSLRPTYHHQAPQRQAPPPEKRTATTQGKSILGSLSLSPLNKLFFLEAAA